MRQVGFTGVLYSSEGQIQATCFQLLRAAKVAMVGQIGRGMGDGPREE